MKQAVSSPSVAFEVIKQKAKGESLLEEVVCVLEQELHYQPSLMQNHVTEGDDGFHQKFNFYVLAKFSPQLKKLLVAEYKKAGWQDLTIEEWTVEDFNKTKSPLAPSKLLDINGFKATHVSCITLHTTLKAMLSR